MLDVRTVFRTPVLELHGKDLSAEECQALARVLRHTAPELTRVDVSGGLADSRAVGEALLSRTTSKLVSVKCKAFDVPLDANVELFPRFFCSVSTAHLDNDPDESLSAFIVIFFRS